MEQTINKPKKTFKQIMKQFGYDYFKYPLYLISHPIAGWEEFRDSKISVAITYLVLMVLAVIYKTIGTGFLVKPIKDSDFNVLITMSTVILPALVGTVANWCVTALFDGKGTMKKIFMVICYSFFPFVWLTFLGTFLSNFIVENEISYVTFISSFAAILTGYMLVFGLKGIHEYGFFKNLITLLFTIVAIAIILFLVLLFLSFVQQILQWIISIISEIRVRYF